MLSPFLPKTLGCHWLLQHQLVSNPFLSSVWALGEVFFASHHLRSLALTIYVMTLGGYLFFVGHRSDSPWKGTGSFGIKLYEDDILPLSFYSTISYYIYFGVHDIEGKGRLVLG
jgi:hypothetical protein